MSENSTTPKVKKKHYRDMSVLVKEMEPKGLDTILLWYHNNREVDGVVYTLHENTEAVFAETIAEASRRGSPGTTVRKQRDMSEIVKDMKSKDLESILNCYYESGLKNSESVAAEFIAETERRRPKA